MPRDMVVFPVDDLLEFLTSATLSPPTRKEHLMPRDMVVFPVDDLLEFLTSATLSPPTRKERLMPRDMVVQQREKKVEETREDYNHAKKGFETAVGELRKAIEAARTGQKGLEFTGGDEPEAKDS